MPQLSRPNPPTQMKLIQFFKNKWYRNAEMVQYWKTKEAVEAKVTTLNGSYVMWMEGEKYPFPGFPRGSILYASVSKLKHEIKNQIFNDAWALLEDGANEAVVMIHVKQALRKIAALAESMRYNFLPVERMAPMVQELHRAWTKVEEGFTGEQLQLSRSIKDAMCFILQEDDSYRFRVQWIMKFFPRWGMRNPTKIFDRALALMVHAEVVGDMKGRIHLLKRILGVILRHEGFKTAFEKLFAELDIKKIRLSKADKYYFRGKYFKVDYPDYEY